jgi:hypothetical protein
LTAIMGRAVGVNVRAVACERSAASASPRNAAISALTSKKRERLAGLARTAASRLS